MPGYKLIIASFLLSAVFVTQTRAQQHVPDRIVPDTAIIQRQYEETDRFYNRLKEKSENSRLARRLYRALVSPDDRTYTPPTEQTGLEKEVSYFREFEGKRIDSITIYSNNVFLDHYSKRDFRTIANSLHRITRESTIRRNLLFREGDGLSPMVMAYNEQRLRSLDFLADAAILVRDNETGDGVNVHIITRDSWSIGLTVRSVPESRRYLDIYDDNILGIGNRLDLRTYFGFKGKFYGGNMLEYTASNLFGSFFELNTLVGWGFDERRLGVKVHKEFILPTDYMAGAVFEDNKYYDSQMGQDTVLLVRHRNYDAWAGKSWSLPALNSSYYLTTRYNDLEYKTRPEVTPDSNSYYHSRRSMLVSTGIYRETYYNGNMIYGFGQTENIPYGHLFEATGGRFWGEFGDRWYTAFTAAVGRQNRWGYARWGGSISSFWDSRGKPIQSILALELDGFSNLWKARRSYVRHFFRLRYMQGWNRRQGEGNILTLWDDASLEGIRRDGITGRVRLIAKNETVLFTPIYFYGFRFVFFGFIDVGTIGEHTSPFRNDFYSSLGLGVRLKNERLNFPTIQLRLGLGFGNHGLVDYRHFRYSSQSRFNVPEFKAGRPEFEEFR